MYRNHKIGPGQKTLHTIWRPVLKGSKQTKLKGYMKPNIIKGMRKNAS